MSRYECIKCGEQWNAETGKYPCKKGGQCVIPAAESVGLLTAKNVYGAGELPPTAETINQLFIMNNYSL